MRARTKSVSLGTRTPSTLLRRVRRAAAAGSGWYPISAAIVRVRAAGAAPTPGEPGASARETVDTCTAARDATAARVTGGAGRAWGGGGTRRLVPRGSGGAGSHVVCTPWARGVREPMTTDPGQALVTPQSFA